MLNKLNSKDLRASLKTRTPPTCMKKMCTTGALDKREALDKG
jgi:hypothetical protein